MDPAWMAVCGLPVSQDFKKRFWLQRMRGASKTADIAVAIAWALFSSRRKINGIVASGDRDQASFVLAAVERLCLTNDWLNCELEVGRDRVINKATKSECLIISSDVASSHGHTVDFVVVDEFTHWKEQGKELWNVLYSTVIKKKHCILLVISNAGFKDSWQWPVFVAIQGNPAWYFHNLTEPPPWMDPAAIEEQRRSLPETYFNRIFRNLWCDSQGDALPEDAIADAATLSGPLPGPEKGWQYFIGVDIGTKKDSTGIACVGVHTGWNEKIPTEQRPTLPAGPWGALADLGYIERPPAPPQFTTRRHAGTGRIKLAGLTVLTPRKGRRIEFAEIKPAIVELQKRFSAAGVCIDAYQAEQLTEDLRAEGIPAEQVHPTGPNMRAFADCLLNAFHERSIEIYPDPTLMADLRSARVVERQYGLRLEWERRSSGIENVRTAHGDAACSLALGLFASRRFSQSAPPDVSDRQLVYWP